MSIVDVKLVQSNETPAQLIDRASYARIPVTGDHIQLGNLILNVIEVVLVSEGPATIYVKAIANLAPEVPMEQEIEITQEETQGRHYLVES